MKKSKKHECTSAESIDNLKRLGKSFKLAPTD